MANTERVSLVYKSKTIITPWTTCSNELTLPLLLQLDQRFHLPYPFAGKDSLGEPSRTCASSHSHREPLFRAHCRYTSKSSSVFIVRLSMESNVLTLKRNHNV